MKKAFAVLLTVSLIIILLIGVTELPHFGHSDNPANNEVMRYYIENAAKDTGAMNIVTGIILDYRAFDTFVETSVLFTAGVLVIMVLKEKGGIIESADIFIQSPILREIGRVVNPFIQIFGLYVIFFGHLSPGGGFSGGTILGASLILYYIVWGSKLAGEKFSYGKLIKIMSTAITLYGVLKGYSFITGGSHLNLPQPPLGTPGNILSGGLLLPLNIIVGIVVAITMYFFFTLFDRGDI